MRKYAFVLMIFGFVVSIHALADASLLILQPGPNDGNDTYVASWAPNNTFNSYNISLLKTSRGAMSEGLIQFNLPAELNGKRLESAYLSLWGYASGYNSVVGLYKITSPWSEDSVTWNTKPSYEDSGYFYPVAMYYEEHAYDVTDIFQSYLSGASDNFGIAIVPQTTDDYGGITFRSSDFGPPRGSESERPRLILNYSAVPEPSSLFLLGLGLFGRGLFRKKKR